MKSDKLDLEKEESLISPSRVKPRLFSPKLNLGVMASGEGTNFEALVKSTRNGELDANISLLIVNNQYCNAIDRAKKLHIPFLILDHKDYKSREELDIQIVNYFRINKVEGIIMAGWMRIVTQILINEFPDRIINIHPSLLPSFRGKNAIDQALKSGVRITGCSVHLVRPEVDSGPVLIQAAVPIYPGDNKEMLTQRIHNQEHSILSRGISIAASNWRRKNIYG